MVQWFIAIQLAGQGILFYGPSYPLPLNSDFKSERKGP